MTDVDMETVSWLVASEYRLETCRVLADSMATPTGIAESTEMKTTHASRSLAALRERGLVALQVPEAKRKGRIYALTEAGEQAYERAVKVNR